ncbi:MAG TPA: hypothetical protein ENH41_03385 [Candidatus Omnitrophica bacterium]|nr:hypothetical protein [Candidatus Omnitrophota bacterium]
MSKHTPGPWRVKESGGCVCSDNKTICQLISINDGALSITPEVEGNAKLISAAPDLLEALKGLLSCDLHKNLTGGYQFHIENAEEAIKRAEAQ